jgi:hypothetical protein
MPLHPLFASSLIAAYALSMGATAIFCHFSSENMYLLLARDIHAQRPWH